MDPTLRKPSSRRFVVGRLLNHAENSFGFTLPNDVKGKIYLTDKFFFPHFDHYREHLSDAAFPINAHARAATLIHEISHIAGNTEDISYLDSSKPFVDLIGTASAFATDLKTALSELQGSALSIKTPYTQLFKIQNPDAGEWEDLGNTTDENTDRIKEHILTLTGEDNLSGARTTFKKDPLIRLAVQLANADSVTWLITHLGRQLHNSAP